MVWMIPQLVAEAGFEDIRPAGDVQVVDLPAQYIDAVQLVLPGETDDDRDGRFPDSRIPVAPQQRPAADVAYSLVVDARAAPDAFFPHAGLFHDAAGFGIVHVMAGHDPVEADGVKEIVHDGPQGFRHDAAAPEGPAQAVADFGGLNGFLQLHDGDASDDGAGFLPLNRPLEETPSP